MHEVQDKNAVFSGFWENPKLERNLSRAFLITSALFILWVIYLAAINNSPGSPDSKSNLDIARNILHGEGFTSHMVIQHFVRQTLPNPEAHRTPAVPYMMALLFEITGINYAVGVLVNGFIVLASAWILRNALVMIRLRWFGQLAGIMMILSSNYEIVSMLNNNFLVFCMCALILLFTAYSTGRLNKTAFFMLASLTCAFGVYLKLTFLLTVLLLLPFMAFALKSEKQSTCKQGILCPCLFLIVVLLLVSPIFIRNLSISGKLLESPLPAIRLADRFNSPHLNPWRSVHFDKPLTYREMIELHGSTWVMKQEILVWVKTVVKVFLLNFPLALLVFTGIIMFFREIKWQKYILPMILMVEPVFSALYWRPETRFLWPVFPCLIWLAGLIISDFYNIDRLEKSRGKARIVKIIPALIVLSLIYGIPGAISTSYSSLRTAQSPTPGWVNITKSIPESSVIMSHDSWSAAWYSERYAVICPIGDRDDLQQVLDSYHPDYYLVTGRGFTDKNSPLTPDDLELVEKGVQNDSEWAFYRLRSLKKQ
jgi:hypothetical protein